MVEEAPDDLYQCDGGVGFGVAVEGMYLIDGCAGKDADGEHFPSGADDGDGQYNPLLLGELVVDAGDEGGVGLAFIDCLRQECGWGDLEADVGILFEIVY